MQMKTDLTTFNTPDVVGLSDPTCTTTGAGREAAVSSARGLEFLAGIFQPASGAEAELDQQKTNLLLKARGRTKEVCRRGTRDLVSNGFTRKPMKHV